MLLNELKNKIATASEATFEKVSHFAKVERFIAAILIFTPVILYYTDFGLEPVFRDSISNYAYMCDSYWFGSLLALAGALFIFNGAQHMALQKSQDKKLKKAESRFGKGYNIIFGTALFGVIYFDHENYTVVHYIFAGIFYIGCSLAMILTLDKTLNILGNILGGLTLAALAIHFVMDWTLGENEHGYTLLWAEWIGLCLIAIYFIAESFDRDRREKEVGLF